MTRKLIGSDLERQDQLGFGRTRVVLSLHIGRLVIGLLVNQMAFALLVRLVIVLFFGINR
jgi:hypothetical protein